jgi:hypothetical protein
MHKHKEALRRLAADRRFIPGIYNYCDQWCERCDFKSRCMNYAFEREAFPDPADRRPGNPEFWHTLSRTLQAAVDLLREAAQKEGLDLDALLRSADASAPAEPAPPSAEPVCCAGALAYEQAVETWLTAVKPVLEARAEEYNRMASLGIPGSGLPIEAARLREALDVIRWHQFRIRVKLLRAAAAAREERASEARAALRDADGSAKVALLAADRSILAWTTLLSVLPDQEDAILERLVLLARLRRETERMFPNARSFIRPGFDEV